MPLSKQNRTAVAIAGGIAAAVGIILIIRYLRKPSSSPALVPATPVAATATPKPYSIWPLKRGSKGNEVKKLQQALIAAYGTGILPKFGADGDWGSETDGAVKAKLNRSQINSEAELNTITEKLYTLKGAVIFSDLFGWLK